MAVHLDILDSHYIVAKECPFPRFAKNNQNSKSLKNSLISNM